MATGDSLIASIRKITGGWQTSYTAAFEELEVMRAAASKSRFKNLFGVEVNHDLSFLGMALLFAAVIASLLFLGVQWVVRSHQPRQSQVTVHSMTMLFYPVA